MGCFDWSVDDHHMILKMVTLRKVLVAHRTGERPLVGVRANMAEEFVAATSPIGAMMTT